MRYDSESIENMLLISELRQQNILVNDSINYAPELRYDFIQWKVSNNSTPSADKVVALSMPGKGFKVRMTQTSPEGNFLLVFPPASEASSVFLRVIDSVNYEIDLENEFYSFYPEFDNTLLPSILQELLRL